MQIYSEVIDTIADKPNIFTKTSNKLLEIQCLRIVGLYKTKLPAGASKLLRAALAYMSLYSPFQSIFLGKLACCVTALI